MVCSWMPHNNSLATRGPASSNNDRVLAAAPEGAIGRERCAEQVRTRSFVITAECHCPLPLFKCTKALPKPCH